MQRASRRRFVKPATAIVSVGGALALVLTTASCSGGAEVSAQEVSNASMFGGRGDNGASFSGRRGGDAAAQTITCPAVADELPEIPESARAEVDRNLALLDKQIADANRRLAASVGQGGPNFVQNAILGPLKAKRAATIERIAIAIGRAGEQPTGLESLAPCTLTDSPGAGGESPQPDQGNGGGQNGDNGQGQNGDNGQGQNGDNGQGDDVARAIGPVAEDFIDIRRVPVSQQRFRRSRNGSSGSFVSRCGTNREGHLNTDNIIISPGVPNGAEHLHDYVGNVSTDFNSTDESLDAAGTTCRIRNDKTSYFWPVLRVRSGNDAPGAPEKDKNNVGTPVRPSAVILEYRGNPTTKVEAMPKFLRLFSGDAKTITNGLGNARPTWSCTGFTNRITDKYPICPRGSRVVRIMDMPSCWDGQNTDSANHRTHVVFPDASGACPAGTKAVPQLRMTLVYNNVPNTRPVGTNVPFAVDGFATERHHPTTDHAGVVEVMEPQLMNFAVRCINSGRRC